MMNLTCSIILHLLWLEIKKTTYAFCTNVLNNDPMRPAKLPE